MKLNCECCGEKMSADFSNNVWCTNKSCLVYDRCFSCDFIVSRAESKANGEQPQIKERLLQGCPNEPLR